MAWRLWKRQGRQRTNSRPRVARAAEAARSAKTEMRDGFSLGLGSARAGASVMLTGAALAGGPGRSGRALGAVVPASPAAVMAAARASNRTIEEVWEETLRSWIGGDVATVARPAAQPAARRVHAWREIDQTLGALRAG